MTAMKYVPNHDPDQYHKKFAQLHHHQLKKRQPEKKPPSGRKRDSLNSHTSRVTGSGLRAGSQAHSRSITHHAPCKRSMMAMTTSNRHTMEERLGSMPGLERGCEPCVAHDKAGVVAPAGPKSQAAIVSFEPSTAHEGAAFAMRRAVGSSEVRQCCIPSPEALGEDLRVCVSLEAPCQSLPAASEISATQTREEALTAAEFKDAFVADAEAQEWIVEVLAHVLDFTIKSNSCEHLADRSTLASALDNFQGAHPCPLSPDAYLNRILRYTRVSPCNILVGVMYMQRLKHKAAARGQDLKLTPFNIQRLLLCAIMLAAKFHDDLFVSNRQWALVGDISTHEMNSLELDMLTELNFNLFVTRDDYNASSSALRAMWSPSPRRVSHTLHASEYEGTAPPRGPSSKSNECVL